MLQALKLGWSLPSSIRKPDRMVQLVAKEDGSITVASFGEGGWLTTILDGQVETPGETQVWVRQLTGMLDATQKTDGDKDTAVQFRSESDPSGIRRLNFASGYNKFSVFSPDPADNPEMPPLPEQIVDTPHLGAALAAVLPMASSSFSAQEKKSVILEKTENSATISATDSYVYGIYECDEIMQGMSSKVIGIPKDTATLIVKICESGVGAMFCEVDGLVHIQTGNTRGCFPVLAPQDEQEQQKLLQFGAAARERLLRFDVQQSVVVADDLAANALRHALGVAMLSGTQSAGIVSEDGMLRVKTRSSFAASDVGLPCEGTMDVKMNASLLCSALQGFTAGSLTIEKLGVDEKPKSAKSVSFRHTDIDGPLQIFQAPMI